MKTHEKDLYLIITNQCDLKCLSCSHGCDVEKTPWFISIKEFENILKQLKEKNVHIDDCQKFVLNITGGEPFLHPQLFDLCKLTKQYFPNDVCLVACNGQLLNKLNDKDILKYAQLGVVFGISLYPDEKLLKVYEVLNQRLTKLQVKFHWNHSHVLFGKYTFSLNINDFQDLEEKQICQQQVLATGDWCLIYKNQLYGCYRQFTSMMQLDMSDLQNQECINNLDDKQNLKDKKTIHCEYCFYRKKQPQEWIPWHRSLDINFPIRYYNLQELYMNNYDIYYNIIHNCNHIAQSLKHPLFKAEFTDFPNHDEYKMASTRFFSGIADIFIPVNIKLTQQLRDKIESLINIQYYNLYFVDYSNDKIIEESNYILFDPSNRDAIFHSYFLKAKSLYDAYFVFLNSSYLNKKILLDINNISNEVLNV